MIQADAAVISALEGGSVRIAYLVALPGNVNVTDWHADLVYNSTTYAANGLLTDLTDVKREQGLKLHTFNLTVTAADQTILQLYQGTNFTGSSAQVWMALMDADDQIIGTPLLVYRGTLDAWSFAEKPERSALTVNLTSPWAAFHQHAGRWTSSDSQQQAHAGDLFFEFAHEERDNIGWGAKP